METIMDSMDATMVIGLAALWLMCLVYDWKYPNE